MSGFIFTWQHKSNAQGLVIFNYLCLKAKLFMHASGITLRPIAVRADWPWEEKSARTAVGGSVIPLACINHWKLRAPMVKRWRFTMHQKTIWTPSRPKIQLCKNGTGLIEYAKYWRTLWPGYYVRKYKTKTKTKNCTSQVRSIHVAYLIFSMPQNCERPILWIFTIGRYLLTVQLFRIF